jgi:hypothetical protein
VDRLLGTVVLVLSSGKLGLYLTHILLVLILLADTRVFTLSDPIFQLIHTMSELRQLFVGSIKLKRQGIYLRLLYRILPVQLVF